MFKFTCILLSWLIFMCQPDSQGSWYFCSLPVFFSEPHTHPLACLWDIGDCHTAMSPWQLLACWWSWLMGMAGHLDPTGALWEALGPLSLLCNHQGAREWILAPPGLWPCYSSRVQKFPSALGPCRQCAGDVFSMPGWTDRACPQALPGPFCAGAKEESASVLQFGLCLSFQRESFYYHTTVHLTEQSCI